MSKPLFRVGQEVVCVEEWEPDDAGAETYRGPLPKLHNIYRIKRVVLESDTGLVFVQLVGFAEPFFEQEGFAPLPPDEALAELKECLEPAYA